MRPKDLKSPFSFAQRKPHFQDGVIHVPIHYDKHHHQDLPNVTEWFDQERPVSIEYCSGNGDWIIQKAIENPHKNFIAVEKLFERVRKIWSKKTNLNVKNLVIVCGDAHTFTKHYLKGPVVQDFYINFPDPWPKKRHEKHRIIQRAFIDEVCKIALPKARLTFVTDDETYAIWAIHELLIHPLWKPLYSEPHFVYESVGYGSSYFEQLWRKKGKNIHYLTFFFEPETVS